MRASGMDTLPSMTMTPAEPIMEPATLSPSTSMATSISSAVRMAAEPPPGTTAFSRPVPLTPPAVSINCRRVIDTGASYTAGFFTRPDTEYMRVPPCVIGFLHRRAEAAPRLHVLAADVDEALRAADRARCDQHALDQRVRVAFEQVPVLESTGLAFVGIDDEVDRTRMGLGDERPLRSRREAGAAQAAEVGLLHLLGDGRRVHLSRLVPGRIAATGPIGIQRVRVRVREVPHQDDLGHQRRPSRRRSIFSGVRFSS